MRQSEVRVGCNCDLIIRLRLAIGRFVLGEVVQRLALQIGFVSAHIACAAERRRIGRHPHGHCVGDRSRDLVFEGKDIGQRMIDGLRPFAEAGCAVGEIGRDPDHVASPLNRTLQKIGYSKLARDRHRVRALVANGVGRRGGQHHQPSVARQRRADLLGQTIGKVRLAGVAAQILERQHCDAPRLGPPGADQSRLPGDQAASGKHSDGPGTGGQRRPSVHTGRWLFRRPRRHRLTHRSRNRPPHRLQLRRTGPAVPAGNVDHLNLPEAQRRVRSIE